MPAIDKREFKETTEKDLQNLLNHFYIMKVLRL